MHQAPRRMLKTEAGRLGDSFRFLRIAAQHELTDPFLSIDQFVTTGSTFPPHPHAGFAAVTYIFDEAETGFLTRDSSGDSSTIAPGDVHWTVAGAGVIHEESNLEPGRAAQGLQIFVNLPEALQAQPPYSIHQSADDRPVVERDGVTRRVVFGVDGGLSAPIAIPVDASLVDLTMASGATHSVFPKEGRTLFLLVRSGRIEVGDKSYASGEAVVIGAEFELVAAETSRVMQFEGARLQQPVFFVGPVAMTSEKAAQRVMDRYRKGLLGRL